MARPCKRTGTGYASWIVLVSVLVLSCAGYVRSQDAEGSVVEGAVVINGRKHIATTDENFICATVDWWPPEKCNFGTCPWGNSSMLRLDLKNPILLNVIKAFSPLKIRLGGSLQDEVHYQTEIEQQQQQPCNDFIYNASAGFHQFNEGCMPLSRWDELNSFIKKAGAVAMFGLNALNGKKIEDGRHALGPWDPTNAASFIKYTVRKGYSLIGFELGNELSGDGMGGMGVIVDADSYANDTLTLHNLLKDIYEDSSLTRPKIVAPGGFYDAEWYRQYLKGTRDLNAITHHIYNLGPGNNPNLTNMILDPAVLDSGGVVFRDLQGTIKEVNSKVEAWVSEAGGAYNSGGYGVSNAFVYGFWYLDQLGQASIHGTKTFCRQTLVGANYGLLNITSFVPNPDYYSALLWHRLMGPNVVSANFNGTRKLRAYAHCAKKSQGVTLLLLNIDKDTTFEMNVEFNDASTYLYMPKQVSFESKREEYHLTPEDGYVQSRVVLLNGKALTLDSSGRVPDLKPKKVKSSEPIKVGPYSIVFVHMPSVVIPACRVA